MTPTHDPQLLKGVLSLLLLQLLAERESYGYEVVQRLHEIGLTDVLEGTVYPALARLEREARVSARLVSSNAGPGAQVLPAHARGLRRARRRHRELDGARRRRRLGPAADPFLPNRSKDRDMAHTVTWIDRLRIERVVWSLDQRLYDLPRKSRIAKRREVRENLVTAASDIGTADALRRLGSSQQLAAEYLSAEFGDDPRPYWVAAATFALTAQLGLHVAAERSRDGVRRRHHGREPERDRHVHVERHPVSAGRGHVHVRARQGQLGRRRVDAARVGPLDRRDDSRRPAVARPVRLETEASRRDGDGLGG